MGPGSSIGAARVPAHQRDTVAAGEGHVQVIVINIDCDQITNSNQNIIREFIVILAEAVAATWETDVVLGQGHWWLRTGVGAVELSGAVTGVAVANSLVKGTAGAAPEHATAAHGHVDGPRLAWVQLRATADIARRPHCVTAVVCNGEGGCACTCSNGGQEEEEEDRGGGWLGLGCHRQKKNFQQKWVF